MKIGVIGAGTMGSGIAQKIAQEGMEVVLVDKEEKFLERGMEKIKQTLDEGVKKRIFKQEDTEKILSLIHPTLSYEQLKECDLIIEAVYEDKKIKEDVFKKLDNLCEKKTIFATNTSSLSVNELSECVERKEKFIGMHFFYHPAKNRFLEIIPSRYTSNEIIAKCLTFSRIIGKVTVITKDSPGFVVNRFFVPFLNESVRILEEKIANIFTIEEVCKEILGIPMGPFELMNVTGVPIAYHAAKFLSEKLGDFYKPAELLKEKTEKGQMCNIEGNLEQDKKEEVKKRIMGAVFYVVLEMLDQNICKIEDIEKGAKVALRWRKGPFEMMNREGIQKVDEYVDEIVKKYSLKKPESLKKQINIGPFKIRNVTGLKKDGVGFIIISRPEALNALNEDVFKEMEEIFEKFKEDKEVQKIVIEGEGKAFAAGADIRFFLKNIESKNLDRIVEFTKYAQGVLNKIEKSEKPFICKLNGMALGGGSEIALASHTVISHPKAYFAFPETGIGIYPGLGGTQRLPRMIGKELAK